jgi:hypothetical protein
VVALLSAAAVPLVERVLAMLCSFVEGLTITRTLFYGAWFSGSWTFGCLLEYLFRLMQGYRNT